MKHGTDWYQREPLAYLGGVQGMSTRQHAVYGVVIDLLYAYGGEIANDPKFIAGYFSDMGTAAVRKTISELIEIGKLIENSGKITQKRAKNQAKTKENLREIRQKAGKKGGEISGEVRKNNHLAEASASSKTQPDKIREEKRREESNSEDKSSGASPPQQALFENENRPQAPTPSKAIFDIGKPLLMASGKSENQARTILGKLVRDHDPADVLRAITTALNEQPIDPVAWLHGALRVRDGPKARSEPWSPFR